MFVNILCYVLKQRLLSLKPFPNCKLTFIKLNCKLFKGMFKDSVDSRLAAFERLKLRTHQSQYAWRCHKICKQLLLRNQLNPWDHVHNSKNNKRKDNHETQWRETSCSFIKMLFSFWFIINSIIVFFSMC